MNNPISSVLDNIKEGALSSTNSVEYFIMAA